MAINQGDCEFVLTDTGDRRDRQPVMRCACSNSAARIVEAGVPTLCVKPAAEAVLDPRFESLWSEWVERHYGGKRPRRLNRPTGAAPIAVHQAWADAGGVTLEEYFEDPLLGEQPNAPGVFDPFERAREILGRAEVDVSSHSGPADVNVEAPTAEDLVGASGASK